MAQDCIFELVGAKCDVQLAGAKARGLQALPNLALVPGGFGHWLCVVASTGIGYSSNPKSDTQVHFYEPRISVFPIGGPHFGAFLVHILV